MYICMRPGAADQHGTAGSRGGRHSSVGGIGLPSMVFVDSIAFKWGWLGSAQRYSQMGRALADLDWEASIIARRDNRTLRGAKEARASFPGKVVVTPFGTFPALVDHRGLRHAWRLARRWAGRDQPPDQVWSERLLAWEGGYEPDSPLPSADVLCGVGYRHWEVLGAVRVIARELGIPYWLDLQDPLEGTVDPDCAGLPEERMLFLREARRVVTTTETYAQRLRQLVPDIADKVVCLRMTHNETLLPQSPAPPAEGRLVLLHTGYLYAMPDRSALPLLRGLARLQERVPAARGQVRVRLLGEGPGMSEAIAGARTLGLGQVLEVLPTVDPLALRTHIGAADVLCVLKAAEKVRDYQVPGKTYDFLFSDKPVLALTYPGELATIIEDTGSGFAVPPDDIEGIAAVLERLLAQKQRWGTVAMRRDPARLQPYSFEAFRQGLRSVIAACAVDTASTPHDQRRRDLHRGVGTSA
jgi:glycosyltransferase involved in cell wall biosynthesis